MSIPVAPRTPKEAMASCALQSAHGPAFGVNECQMQAHLRYLVPSDGTPSAAAWWAKAKYKRVTKDPSTAPFGAFHYWTGGSSGDGHVAPSRGGSPCWSTDIKRDGFYDATTVEHINATWTLLEYVGWCLDIDGVLCVPSALHLFVPDPPPLVPFPLPRRVKMLHHLARRARRNGHVRWARRIDLWAEEIQKRINAGS